MTTILSQLRRQTPQPTPAQFVRWNPGCFIQYFDDTAAKDGSKALSTVRFDPDTAEQKQRDRCAVCFSLQAFQGSRTTEGFLSFRNLGADIDLIPHAGGERMSDDESDRRKNEYLANHLFRFPLRPHWLIETRHGFHAVYRIMPVREPTAVRDAQAVNARLVKALHGDERAMLLTQLLRVPGTHQYKEPDRPFLCRLLLDTAATVAPYTLDRVRAVLDAWEDGQKPMAGSGPTPHRDGANAAVKPSQWKNGIAGVSEGSRNTTAASIIGAILARLPEPLWLPAGWGGLKEWNGRNGVPLPEVELRLVYLSISRRERLKRRVPVAVLQSRVSRSVSTQFPFDTPVPQHSPRRPHSPLPC